MSVLAAIRPDSVNFPLFLHVFGAMLLVGTLFAVALATLLGRSRPDDAVGLTRFSLKTLLIGVLPAYILMRIGAQWIYSKEGWDDVPDKFRPGWLDIGVIIGDLGGLILLVSLLAGGVGVYRLREGKGSGLLKVTLVLSLVLLAAYVVAVWAMAGKPD